MWSPLFVCLKENKMIFNSKNEETSLVRMYRTEYRSDYNRMKKLGYEITDNDVRSILGFPKTENKKRFFGLF
jgi:hypothetical protein